MHKPKRVFIVADIGNKGVKMFLNQMPKLAKGFIRLGHDVKIFSYCDAIQQVSLFKSKTLNKWLYKRSVDRLLASQVRNYQPDIVYISFARLLDAETITIVREAAPSAVFIGGDGDPWPKMQQDRIETAKGLDILTATNDGQFLQDYRDTGVPLCVFMPNMCDPDIDRRYEVGPEWQTDILWTGKAKHHADNSESLREEIVMKLIQREKCSIYGCHGRPKIGGISYLYAISGAKIGVNVNAVNTVRLYHSDRLTHYLACGILVLAKRVPDTELLYKDREHLRYFDSADEFFDLADWYLNHEKDRKKIADSGMKWVHEQFNSLKVAEYILELVERGSYSSPWS